MQDSDIIYILRVILIEEERNLKENSQVLLRNVVAGLMQRQPYFCKYCSASTVSKENKPSHQ